MSKSKTSANTSDEVYNSWYDAVYEPQQGAADSGTSDARTEEPNG